MIPKLGLTVMRMGCWVIVNVLLIVPPAPAGLHRSLAPMQSFDAHTVSKTNDSDLCPRIYKVPFITITCYWSQINAISLDSQNRSRKTGHFSLAMVLLSSLSRSNLFPKSRIVHKRMTWSCSYSLRLSVFSLWFNELPYWVVFAFYHWSLSAEERWPAECGLVLFQDLLWPESSFWKVRPALTPSLSGAATARWWFWEVESASQPRT